MINPTKYIVTDWIPDTAENEDVPAIGAIVYKFYGPTYGCITPQGVAVTLNENGDGPFFEVPYNCVAIVE